MRFLINLRVMKGDEMLKDLAMDVVISYVVDKVLDEIY
jgi:hypothetical protein